MNGVRGRPHARRFPKLPDCPREPQPTKYFHASLERERTALQGEAESHDANAIVPFLR